MMMVNMATVWDRATEFLSDNLPAIVPIASLAIFAPYAIQGIIQPLTAAGGAAAVGLDLVGIVFSIASLWGQIAIISLALDPLSGRTPAVLNANRRVWPSIGIALLLFLGVIALMAPVPVALAISGVDVATAISSGRPDIPAGVAGFVSCYMLVVLAVMAWLIARLALLYPVIVMERRGVAAVVRSFRLTRGHTLKIGGVLILFAVVAIVAVLAAQTVFGSILSLLAGGDGAVTVASVLTSILVGAVKTGFTVLAAAFTAKLYLAVRDAREAIVESA